MAEPVMLSRLDRGKRAALPCTRQAARMPPMGTRQPTFTRGLDPLIKNWWLMATRGVLAILLGITMLAWRTPTFEAVIVPFAMYALIDGIVAIASALRAAGSRFEGWPIALGGVVSVGLGALTLVWPFLTHRAITVLAAWGILTGIFEIVAAMRLPRQIAAHWLVATGGVSSVFLALFVLGLPRASSDRVALILAIYALVFGLVILLAALRFRSASRALEPAHRR
jgi:uncharacterized membrane protein HdeD (DUF308 family)